MEVIFLNIDDSIQEFINYCIFEKGLSKKTEESYRNDLKVYHEFLEKKKIYKVEDITSSEIKDFLKHRNSLESTSTIAHNLTVIKNFHSYLFRQKIISKDVSEFIERPKLKKRLPKSLSISDIDCLLDIPLNNLFD